MCNRRVSRWNEVEEQKSLIKPLIYVGVLRFRSCINSRLAPACERVMHLLHSFSSFAAGSSLWVSDEFAIAHLSQAVPLVHYWLSVNFKDVQKIIKTDYGAMGSKNPSLSRLASIQRELSTDVLTTCPFAEPTFPTIEFVKI